MVSILILLDYLFLSSTGFAATKNIIMGLNPYFIGLPILITKLGHVCIPLHQSQSLFYWITYSYNGDGQIIGVRGFQSQSLFYWITYSYIYCIGINRKRKCLNPYFIGLPILIR